ncbi:MAG: glutamate synthase subunit alpha, partial [Planctomycetes bacterium]|nr:glutamate synthase subunit alpha [Planctomycetota bacterium]
MIPTAPRSIGLYDPQFEHDACGVGFILRLDNAPNHDVVEDAILALRNLKHRGATGADADSGDGAGILLRIPDATLRNGLEFDLPPEGEYAVGMMFLPPGEAGAAATRREIGEAVGPMGWTLLGWRRVPVRPDALGKVARAAMPSIWQAFFTPPTDRGDLDADGRERLAYVLRKRLKNVLKRPTQGEMGFYIASLSFRTVVYKGMTTSFQLEEFYADLHDPLTV